MGVPNAKLIFAEFLSRRERGESVDILRLCAEHPEFAGELKRLLAARQENALGPDAATKIPVGAEQSVFTSGEGFEDQAWARFLKQLESRGPGHSRYENRGELGRGGMGVILRIFDVDIRRPLAMKLILGRGDSSEDGESPSAKRHRLGRFLEEAQITGQLDHPGVVPVHELGLDAKGQVYFTMKLVEGQDLRSVFRRVADPNDDDWNQTRALSVLLRACEAVAYAHDKGVIHRDLKPGNIMVGKYGEAYVMDWGLARVLGQQDRLDIRIQEARPTRAVESHRQEGADEPFASPLVTMDGDIVGTPAYMPPEQAAGKLGQIGRHSDVYAMGAMIYHLLAGHMPYEPTDSQTHQQTLWNRVQEGPPAELHKIVRNAPAELVAICERAMARDIERRYPAMADLARDLQAYLEGRVVGAYESGALAELKKWVQRNRALSATAALALVAVLALSGWALFERQTARENERVALANEQRAEQSASEARSERDRADENAERARRNAEELGRLSDVKTLLDLKTEAKQLWSARPEQAPLMRGWLSRAQLLLDRLPLHERTLLNLRRRGIPGSDSRMPELEELRRRAADLEQEILGFEDLQGITEQQELALKQESLDRLRGQIASLEAAIQREQPYEFEQEHLAWWHETLVGLVSGLIAFSEEDPFGETLFGVRRRLEFAETIRRNSITYYQDEWDEAIASIGDMADCPKYNGLELKEQLGLVPIGRNPESELWEFWHVRTGGRTPRDEHEKLMLTEKSGIVFVLIPGGTFWMGAQSSDPNGHHYDPQAESNESDDGGHPVEVTLDPFFLSKYELTQSQWERMTGAAPSLYRPGMTAGGRPITRLHPVELVSWDDCFELAGRLGLTLPTEAQWEYGCRGGSSTVYHSGDEFSSLDGFTNLADEGSRSYYPAGWPHETEFSDGYGAHAPVGSFRGNGFGLHDMHGNVWEWCLDGFGSYDDPPRAGDGARHLSGARVQVNRGGSFTSLSVNARSAYRDRDDPARRDTTLGTRFAKPLAGR